MTGGRQGLSLVITFVLAAVLGPRVFGLAAMATVYVMFVDLFQSQGMAAALIQRKDLTPAHKDTGFWMVMALSLAVTGVGVAGAGWWAGVNQTPELENVILALSPLVMLQGLTTVQEALLRRDMLFKSLALRTLSAVFAGGLVGLTGALLGWGVYALIAQQLTYAVVSVVVLWSVSGWHPRFRISMQAGRELLGFSSGTFLTSIAVFVNRRADELLIGLFFGPTVVGVYRLGARLIDMLLTGIVGPVRSMALPELAPHQDNLPELRRRLVRLMRLSSLVAFPLVGVLFAAATPLTELLGPEWAGAAPVIQVMCLVGVVRVITTLDGPLLQAVGSPFVQAGVTGVTAVISAATFVLSGWMLADTPVATQAVGMAVARAFVFGLPIMIFHTLILRHFSGLSLKETISPFAAPFIVGVVSGVAGSTVLALWPTALTLPRLALSVLAAGVVGAWLMWRTVPEFAETVRAVLGRVRSARLAKAGTS